MNTESHRTEFKVQLTDSLEKEAVAFLNYRDGGVIPKGFSEEEFFMGYSVPQNKELMRIFRDLDMVEQLGSGIPRILAHYPQSIYQLSPNFIRLVFPYAEGFETVTGQAPDKQWTSTGQVNAQATPQATPQAKRVLQFCMEPKGRFEIQEYLGLKDREYFRKSILLPLIESEQLQLTLPNKPTSPKQKFVTVQKQEGNDG